MINYIYNIFRDGIEGIFGIKSIFYIWFAIAMPAQIQDQNIEVFSKIPYLFVPYRTATARAVYEGDSLLRSRMWIGKIIQHWIKPDFNKTTFLIRPIQYIIFIFI